MKTVEQLEQEAQEAKDRLSKALEEYDVCNWKVAGFVSDHIIDAAVARMKHEMAAEKNKPVLVAGNWPIK